MREKVTLGSLCKPVKSQVSLENDTLIDYFDISSVDNENKKIIGCETYMFSEAPSRARRVVNKGNIIVSTVRPNLNAVALFDKTTENIPIVSTGFCVLECKDDVDSEFVFHFCKSKTFIEDMVSKATGASYPAVNDKIIRDTLIPMYSYDEQRKISNELGKVSGIIERRKKELIELDNLVKSRFVEMFGNKGVNPNGYDEDILGNLYRFQYGKGNNIPEDKGEYPCYGSNGIVGHHTEFNSEDAPIIGHIGAYAGIVNWGAGKHYVTYNGVICKLKTERINPIYGFYLLQQQDFNRVATKGGGQPFVSYGDLESPMVVVPPIEVQNAYATFATQVDKLKF